MSQPTLEEFQTKPKCGNCQKRFIANIHTTTCPHCSFEYKNGEVYKFVHDIYDATYNNTFSKVGNAMKSTGQGMQQAGNSMSSIGCGLFIIAIVILIVFILLMGF